MASARDPVLSHCVGAHDATRVYDAAPAPKNKVSLQGPLRKVYSISNVYDIDQLNIALMSEHIYNPITAMGFSKCLPFSWTIIRNKQCRHPFVVMGVVDMFGQ